MSNAIANFTTQTAAIVGADTDQGMTWTTKAGKVRTAHSATVQANAPKAVQMAAARERDLAMLANGQYRPFLRDVAGALSASDRKALERLGFDLVGGSKAQVTQTLSAIARVWDGAKGDRAALRLTMLAWLDSMEQSVAATLEM